MMMMMRYRFLYTRDEIKGEEKSPYDDDDDRFSECYQFIYKED